jgi:hypothetical protein|tara:strand:- start:891 stop:1199 length:309 start_codon:yes stop_codon:yes gene_type:complete
VWCQGLILGNSEDGILARLAQARDGKFFEGEGIAEGGLENITTAGYTGASLDALHAINARDGGKEGLDGGSLGGCLEGLFHAYIVSNFGGGFKRGVGFISHL